MLVVQTVPDHAQNRVSRIAGKPGCFSDVADLDSGENLLDPFRIAAHPAAEPPEDALEDNGQRRQRDNQDRPHDGAALFEIIDEEIFIERPFRARGRGRRTTWGGRCTGSGSSLR